MEGEQTGEASQGDTGTSGGQEGSQSTGTQGQGEGTQGQSESNDGNSSVIGDLMGDGQGENDDTKAEGQKKEGEGEGAKKDEGEKKAPESYEQFKLPDGFEVPEELAGEFQDLAKELSLTQEQAQKMVDFKVKVVNEAVRVAAENAAKESEAKTLDDYKVQVEGFKKETLEYLGSGDQAKVKTGHVKTFLNHTSKEFATFLNETGLGNHPLLFKTFEKIGSMLSEDTLHRSGGSGNIEKSYGEIFYPNMK